MFLFLWRISYYSFDYCKLCTHLSPYRGLPWIIRNSLNAETTFYSSPHPPDPAHNKSQGIKRLSKWMSEQMFPFDHGPHLSESSSGPNYKVVTLFNCQKWWLPKGYAKEASTVLQMIFTATPISHDIQWHKPRFTHCQTLSGSQSVIQEVMLVSTHLPWGPAHAARRRQQAAGLGSLVRKWGDVRRGAGGRKCWPRKRT